MRICFFIGGMHLGGVGKWALNLTHELVKQGIQVDFFLFHKDGEYLSELPDNVNVHIVEGNYIKRILLFIVYLIKYHPKVSISTHPRLDIINILTCIITFGVTKPMITIHTIISSKLSQMKNPNIFYPKLSKILYKIPKKIVAVSNGVADDFSKLYNINRKKITVIYNPVYSIYNEKDTKPNVPKSFQDLINLGTPFIITACRLREPKDFTTLLKAFKLIHEKEQIKLVILGSGPLKENILLTVKKLNLEDKVLLLGYVNNPQYFIRKASVFVLSSKWEGFGNVLVEALGVGTQVVSTDCPSGPAEILCNGKFGNLAPVGDEHALAKAISHSLNNPIKSKLLIQRAENFSIEKITQIYISYFNQ